MIVKEYKEADDPEVVSKSDQEYIESLKNKNMADGNLSQDESERHGDPKTEAIECTEEVINEYDVNKDRTPTEIPDSKVPQPKKKSSLSPVPVNDLVIKDNAWEVAKWLFEKKLVPESFKTPQQVMLGIQTAISFGFNIFGQISKAINQMMVIKNGVTIYGDLPLAIVKERACVTHFKEYFIDKEYNKICIENKNLEADPIAAICEIGIDGSPPNTYPLTKKDLESAGGVYLGNGCWKFTQTFYSKKLGKKVTIEKDPWKLHGKIMWIRRNRAFALKCEKPDLIYGTKIWEYDDIKEISEQEEKSEEIKSEFRKDFQIEQKGRDNDGKDQLL